MGRQRWIPVLLFAAYGGHACADIRTTPVAGKTVISKASYDLWANTSVMIVSSKGTVVLMDPFETLPGIRPDLLTVSHFHGDHFDPYLLGFVPSARSTSKAESFSYKDVQVQGLASTHHGKIDYSWPTNVVYILTVDGIRIAHLGDFGQTELTEEQRRALAGVDVLIAPFTDLLVPQEKSLALIRQIQPKMLFPTHRTRAGMRMLKTFADDVIVRDDRIEIGPGDLKAGRTRLVLLERSDYGFLFLRFLVMEFPTYPISKFIFTMLLLMGLLWYMARRILRKRLVAASN